MERVSDEVLMLSLQHLRRRSGVIRSPDCIKLLGVGMVSRRFHQLVIRMIWSCPGGVSFQVMYNYFKAVRESPFDAPYFRLMRHLDMRSVLRICKQDFGQKVLSATEAYAILALSAPYFALTSLCFNIDEFDEDGMISAIQLARLILLHDRGTLRSVSVDSVVLRLLEMDRLGFDFLHVQRLTITLTERLSQWSAQTEHFGNPFVNAKLTATPCTMTHLSLINRSDHLKCYAPLPVLTKILSLRPLLKSITLAGLTLCAVIRKELIAYLASPAAAGLNDLTISGDGTYLNEIMHIVSARDIRIKRLHLTFEDGALGDNLFEKNPVMASVQLLRVHFNPYCYQKMTSDVRLDFLGARFPSVIELELSQAHLVDDAWKNLLHNNAMPNLANLMLDRCSSSTHIFQALLRRETSLRHLLIICDRTAMEGSLVMLLCFRYFVQDRCNLSIHNSGLFRPRSSLVRALQSICPGIAHQLSGCS